MINDFFDKCLVCKKLACKNFVHKTFTGKTFVYKKIARKNFLHKKIAHKNFLHKKIIAFLCAFFLLGNFCIFALDTNDAGNGSSADANAVQTNPTKTKSNAQKVRTTEAGVPEPYTKDEFPSWVHTLRRGEIISIGSLPFTLFATGTAYSLYNFFKHDMDSAYAPNPFAKNFSSVPLSDKEKGIILLSASGLSLGIGVADYIIEKVLTNAQSKNDEKSNAQNVLPEGVTITPVYKDDDNKGVAE